MLSYQVGRFILLAMKQTKELWSTLSEIQGRYLNQLGAELGDDRKRLNVLIRVALANSLRRYMDAPLLGRWFRKDRTTVMHWHKTHSERYSNFPVYRNLFHIANSIVDTYVDELSIDQSGFRTNKPQSRQEWKDLVSTSNALVISLENEAARARSTSELAKELIELLNKYGHNLRADNGNQEAALHDTGEGAPEN